MFRLTAPSEDEVGHFLAAQKDSGFSYPEVGRSATVIPAGYDVDRNRVQIGRGALTWQRAVEAIRAWQMFGMPWVRLYWPSAPIQVGTDVAFLVRHFGFYSLSACRIVYVVDEDGPVKRFGFAYGTLTEHAERGEERFTVEWKRDEDQVWYDIPRVFSTSGDAGQTRLSPFPLTPKEVCRGFETGDAGSCERPVVIVCKQVHHELTAASWKRRDKRKGKNVASNAAGGETERSVPKLPRAKLCRGDVVA